MLPMLSANMLVAQFLFTPESRFLGKSVAFSQLWPP
jgi:hypothetical protein